MSIKSIGLSCLLTLLAMLGTACKGDKNVPPPKQESTPISVPEKSPTVLQIDELRLDRDDFSAYLSSRYPDLDLETKHAKLLSRLFDNFEEYQIMGYLADQAGVTVSSEELPELSEKFQLPADSLPRPILLKMALIQKYLYLNYYQNQEVSEREISDHYRRNREEFRLDAEVHLYQILVSDKEKAIELRGILQNTPDRFEELARTHSISPEAPNNGYMGTFEKGTLPEEMENVVFSLRAHQISPVVESKFGFHIFKVTRRSNRRTLPLQRVREQIRSELMSRKVRAAYDAALQQARDTLQISRFPQNLGFTYTSETGDDEHEKD